MTALPLPLGEVAERSEDGAGTAVSADADKRNRKLSPLGGKWHGDSRVERGMAFGECT